MLRRHARLPGPDAAEAAEAARIAAEGAVVGGGVAYDALAGHLGVRLPRADAEPVGPVTDPYLAAEPVRAVALHGAGVHMLVPSPGRYAVHGLLRRDRRGKSVAEALRVTRRHRELGDAIKDALDEGVEGARDLKL